MRTNFVLTRCKQRAVHCLSMKIYLSSSPELLKSNFFRSKNFNIFYDSGPEKFSITPLRAPTWPEKNPTKPEKNFISEINFSTSEVEITDF